MLIDTHAHLTDPKFDADRQTVLERAEKQGLEKIMIVGDTVASSQAAIDLAMGQSWLLSASAGVHPHHAASYDDATTIAALQKMTTYPVCVAIGEIGLDYHYDFSPREAQRRALQAQLELACASGLPVILHCRDAFDDLFAVLSDSPLCDPDFGAGGVLHCFTGDADQARRAVEQGLYIGIGGMITFKKADALREALMAVPLERMLIESDAPYLAPHPHRGRRNEPAFTIHTAQALAELRGVSVEKITEITTQNAYRLFGGSAGDESN